MNAAEKYNLTQGGILSKLLLVAVPIMGTQLLQMAYNLTDMFWLGRVGSDAVAASGSAGMYLWLSMGFLMIARMGAEIGVAQCKGGGDEQSAQRYTQNSLFLGAVLGVFFASFTVLFPAPLIQFFGLRETGVVRDAAVYLRITGAAIPLTYLSGAATGSFNSSGNSRMPFYINAAGLAVNMVLDPLLIFAFGMGVTGAAVATSLAQVLVCALFLLALKWGPGRPFPRFRLFARPGGSYIRQIFRWSLPIGMESMLFTLFSMVVTRFVASFTADAVAVQRVGSQIESLSWLIGGGFASAITAFIGQNYGAGKWTRIRRGFRISLVTILGWGAVVSLTLFFGARVLFWLLLPEPATLDMGVSYLRILACCQITTCMEAAGGGAFRGVGKTLPPSLVSVACNALRVPLCWWLSTTSLGLDGIWWGITIGSAVRGLGILAWYLADSRRQPREDAPVNPAADMG